MNDNINIVGITPLDHYPNSGSIRCHKQNISNLNLSIPCQKPDIEYINEVNVKLCIDGYKIINTILGPKLVANLSISVNIIYIAQNLLQTVHSSHWSMDTCDFMLLEDIRPKSINICADSLFSGIEDISVINVNDKSLCVSVIYILCFCDNNDNQQINYIYKDCGCSIDKQHNYTPNKNRCTCSDRNDCKKQNYSKYLFDHNDYYID
ncbi:MAG: hypothetical protein ACRC3Y_03160 [Romboutsia sp.]|uniref:hypothetical protein n=1 Tax=Romboutsia sp. TaxID=1965302 RepID=UPI003F2D53F0